LAIRISGLLLKTKYAVGREWMSAISETGNIISAIGLGLTVSVLGAEIGVPLVAIGGWMSIGEVFSLLLLTELRENIEN